MILKIEFNYDIHKDNLELEVTQFYFFGNYLYYRKRNQNPNSCDYKIALNEIFRFSGR